MNIILTFKSGSHLMISTGSVTNLIKISKWYVNINTNKTLERGSRTYLSGEPGEGKSILEFWGKLLRFFAYITPFTHNKHNIISKQRLLMGNNSQLIWLTLNFWGILGKKVTEVVKEHSLRASKTANFRFRFTVSLIWTLENFDTQWKSLT